MIFMYSKWRANNLGVHHWSYSEGRSEIDRMYKDWRTSRHAINGGRWWNHLVQHLQSLTASVWGGSGTCVGTIDDLVAIAQSVLLASEGWNRVSRLRLLAWVRTRWSRVEGGTWVCWYQICWGAQSDITSLGSKVGSLERGCVYYYLYWSTLHWGSFANFPGISLKGAEPGEHIVCCYFQSFSHRISKHIKQAD